MNRWRQHKSANKPANRLAVPSFHEAPGSWKAWLVKAVASVAVAAALAITYRLWSNSQTVGLDKPGEENQLSVLDEKKSPPPVLPDEKPIPAKPDEPDTFLDEFKKEPAPEKQSDINALSDDELEIQFQRLVERGAKIESVKASALANKSDPEKFKEAIAFGQQIQEQFDKDAARLEKWVAAARRARPNDAVPRWLTGELLLQVGGEPEEVLPHLRFALGHGLNRPRLRGSLALVYLGMNRFAEALRTIEEALDKDGTDRFLWDVFKRAAFNLNQFDRVIQRLDRVFPTIRPEWAQTMRREAEELQARWQAEEQRRRAEATADDLPRVRLIIEHRRFARDRDGKQLNTIESTGREEVILELFENEAPNTVANFIELTERKFYDGTRFHLALPAMLVQGGDPNTRNADPADHGLGGPGYTIADEFGLPGARSHFRGSLSMVTAPNSAGSQFFLCLAPQPEMNGHFTVFGRVLQGQDAIDRITRGRTTRDLGHHGKIIPGDLLVSAEVVRKRGHEYRAVKKK
jgi:peptidyl-prolyl cis-trans isomerase B (cyclophilin B)